MNGDPRGADASCAPPPFREGGRGGEGTPSGASPSRTLPSTAVMGKREDGEAGPSVELAGATVADAEQAPGRGRRGTGRTGEGLLPRSPIPPLRAMRRRHPPQPLPPPPPISCVACATRGDGVWRPHGRGSAATRCRPGRSCRPRHNRRRRSQNAPPVAHRQGRSVGGSAAVVARAVGRGGGAGRAGMARTAAATGRRRGAGARGGGGAATCPLRSGPLRTPVGQPILPPTAPPGCPPPSPPPPQVGVSPFAGGAPPRAAATPPTGAPSPAAATATRSAP